MKSKVDLISSGEKKITVQSEPIPAFTKAPIIRSSDCTSDVILSVKNVFLPKLIPFLSNSVTHQSMNGATPLPQHCCFTTSSLVHPLPLLLLRPRSAGESVETSRGGSPSALPWATHNVHREVVGKPSMQTFKHAR